MEDVKLEYLRNLRTALHDHPDANDICNEIAAHIEDGIREKMLVGISEKFATKEMLQQLGDPFIFAKSFVVPKQPVRIRNFILLNWLFFIGGVVVTIVSHESNLILFRNIWDFMVNWSFPILLLYSLYWLYLGYSIGKHYGPNGKKVVNTSLMKASIPNILLMTGVISKVIPADVFSPMLNPLFISLCVLVTILFYPLSKFAFKIGIVHGL
ncbi:hypothetical protein [Bacillus sp. FJAT-49736]|uniref:hypothetical protein n=1 Tax=Bacillus sp. FJAT-49736 TaxID=2833582 RepID=UPI001BC99CE3|nr:hypothetical protein [Bacillus sp. FJAT-49736]MBS4172813.1 hypothetical protein [Bacillus sp. FJAT-49736]